MNGTVDALIIYADARGFTSWAEKVENFNFIDVFSKKWYGLLDEIFSGHDEYAIQIKYLGDGAMVIREIKEEITVDFLQNLIDETLIKVVEVNNKFDILCKEFSIIKGTTVPLKLGWGINRGTIKKLDNKEYIGAEINKCARYCGFARPFGIVIDVHDFPKPSESALANLEIELFRREPKLKGIVDIPEVWVTKEISTNFWTREELKQAPEVHVAGLCFKQEKNRIYVLLGKRKASRRLFPSLYEGCGGQLAYGESFTDGVKRHYSLEYGVEIEVYAEQHSFYLINEADEPLIPGIRFLCEYIGGEPKSENHEPPTPKWFSEKDFYEMEEESFIKGLKKEIEKGFTKFKEMKST